MVGGLAPLVSLAVVLAVPASAAAACAWAFPVGDAPESPAPLADNHPVGGMNLPQYGSHLGADYWVGGGCTSLGQSVYAVADGEIVEIVDGLGSYLDVVVIRHDDAALGPIYSMYGHIARDPGLMEGQDVTMRDPIGTIDDVLAYFSPCHLHFELLSQAAYDDGPFCNGCAAAGYHVSPGYDQQVGVTAGMEASGDTYLEVDDAIAGNRWYHTDAFLEARLDAECGRCGDGSCGGGESYESCPADCPPCQLVPPEGGILEDTGPCFVEGGDPQYWHYEDGAGSGGAFQWTHTTDSAMVDNHGVWNLALAEAGSYRVEAYVEAGSADTQLARYRVTTAAGMQEHVVDQSAGAGWVEVVAEVELGEGGGQSIRLDDNTGEPFSGMTRIVFDAIRLTRLDLPPGDTGGDDTGGGDLDGDDGDVDGDDGDVGDGGTEGPGDDGGDDGIGDDATGGVATGYASDALPGATDRGDAGGCSCRGGSGSAPSLPMLVLMALRRGSTKRSRARALSSSSRS